MKHYSEEELNAKIQAFMSAKLEKYPELDESTNAPVVTREPLQTRIYEAFTWFRPVALN